MDFDGKLYLPANWAKEKRKLEGVPTRDYSAKESAQQMYDFMKVLPVDTVQEVYRLLAQKPLLQVKKSAVVDKRDLTKPVR